MKVFVDSCVWIQAFIYPDRKAGEFLAAATQKKEFSLVISKSVILELSRYMDRNPGIDAQNKLAIMLKSGMVEYLEAIPTKADLAKWKDAIIKRDRHILAGAFISKADALVSVDFDHVITTKVKKNFPIPVFDPEGFMKWFRKGGNKA